MKISILLLIFICLSASVRLYAQQAPTITLSVKNVPLETVLGQMKKQTGVTFVYNKDILKTIGKISVEVQKADLQTVLKLIFRNTPCNFTFFESTVVLSNKKDADGNITIDSTFFSKGTIHGFVYDPRQKGLSNATVTIKRSHVGTIANAKGEFTLDNVRTNDTLRISFIGYATQNIPVNGITDFSVVLTETKNDLDEVIVQAYGTTTKRLTVGEISQVNAKDIEKQPITNPILALEGQVPGLLITPTSGFSGAPVKVVLRGQSSINPSAMTDPLYIIDGMPLITLNFEGVSGPYAGLGASTASPGLQQSGSSYSGGQSPFFSLNPGDIESITVLKDAEATAMYGSRAGNGVIIITTKKGKPGSTQFNISTDQSVNKTIGQWDMLNTSQYLQMRREAFRNDGLTPTTANAPDLTLWDTTRYTNWQKALLQSTNNTNVATSLSGGDNFLTFRMSASYSALHDLAALSNTNKNQRATVSLNLNHTSLNQKLSVSLTALYGYTSTSQVSIGGSLLLPPDAPPIFDKNGNLNYAPWNAAGLGSSFPFASLLEPALNSTYLLNSNLSINYQLIKGLNISVSLGYNNSQDNNSTTNPIAAQNPINNPLGTAAFGNNSNIGFNINPEITYSHLISKGTLGVTLGTTLNNTNAQTVTLYGSGYTSDELLKSIINAPVQQIGQNYIQDKYEDIHGRVNYNWENKYIVEVSGNRDGSSSFAPGRQFGNFWSAGANWIASEEKWLKEALPSWVSLIKLSGTYGTTGISGGDYKYLSQWSGSPIAGSPPLYDYNGSLPLAPIDAANQDYHWETDKTINVSFDLGFLNDRFNLHVTYYQKRVNNQLTTIPTPVFTGFSNVVGNSKADVQNTGMEVSLNANLITTKDFTWSANFNISQNANKLLAFPGIQYTPYYTTEKVGESIGTVYSLHYLGIDPQTGQRSYEDYNHDGIIQTVSNNPGPPGVGTSDARVAINLAPKFIGGAGTSFRYKSVTLGLLFDFEKKITQVAYTLTAGGILNAPVEVLNNSWQKPGDMAAYPRFTTTSQVSDGLFYLSDGAYTDGSFLRLQNVNIAYALPDRFAKRLGIKGMSVAISMQNVLTFTKYDGIDPDVPFGTLPQPKVFNGKLLFNF